MNTRGIIQEVILHRDRIEDWQAYPFCIPAVRAMDRLAVHPKATFFVGENGSGKSTLLEAIAIAAGFNPEGGSISLQFSEHPSESRLCDFLTIARGIRRETAGFFLRAETMFNVATQVHRLGLFEYGWKDIHAMSHGEAFLWVVEKRFRPNGLYLLDEPESALSPQRQLALLRNIHELASQGSQFIISTHSPILMAYPNATIYRLNEAGIEAIALDQAENFRVMRAFLMNPERFFRDLFD